MSLPPLSLNDLLNYTEWERQRWRAWFGKHGNPPLRISAGPHGDGRFESIGHLVRHIFSAEKRYVERLSDRPLTDPAAIPVDDIDALFQFGQQSRSALPNRRLKLAAPHMQGRIALVRRRTLEQAPLSVRLLRSVRAA